MKQENNVKLIKRLCNISQIKYLALFYNLTPKCGQLVLRTLTRSYHCESYYENIAFNKVFF